MFDECYVAWKKGDGKDKERAYKQGYDANNREAVVHLQPALTIYYCIVDTEKAGKSKYNIKKKNMKKHDTFGLNNSEYICKKCPQSKGKGKDIVDQREVIHC